MKFSLKRESFLLFSNNYSHDIDYSLLYSNRIYLKNSTKQNWDHCKLHLECLSNLHSTIHSLIVKVYSIQINKKNISYKRTTIEQIKWKQFKHLLLPFFLFFSFFNIFMILFHFSLTISSLSFNKILLHWLLCITKITRKYSSLDLSITPFKSLFPPFYSTKKEWSEHLCTEEENTRHSFMWLDSSSFSSSFEHC